MSSKAAAVSSSEPLRLRYVRNLPWFAQSGTVPRNWKFFGLAALLPLWTGAVAVHVLPLMGGKPYEGAVEGTTASSMGSAMGSSVDRARNIMSVTIHYACALVAGVSALHWGLEAARFGLPSHTVEYLPLYRFVRFGLPVVPLLVAALSSRLSVENPRSACVVLMCVSAAGTMIDFFSFTFASAPVWFPRYQWWNALGVIGGLFVLMTSERMQWKGDAVRIEED